MCCSFFDVSMCWPIVRFFWKRFHLFDHCFDCFENCFLDLLTICSTFLKTCSICWPIIRLVWNLVLLVWKTFFVFLIFPWTCFKTFLIRLTCFDFLNTFSIWWPIVRFVWKQCAHLTLVFPDKIYWSNIQPYLLQWEGLLFRWEQKKIQPDYQCFLKIQWHSQPIFHVLFLKTQFVFCLPKLFQQNLHSKYLKTNGCFEKNRCEPGHDKKS